MHEAVRSVDMVRVRGGTRAADIDRAAIEEPLEIRLHNRPFAVIMRTPGADRELTAGFLLAEQVVAGADDLGTIQHCPDWSGPAEAGRHESGPIEVGRVGADPRVPPERTHGSAPTTGPHGEAPGNVVNVTLTDDTRLERLLADRRQVTMSSSCGLCGRLTIESLMADVPPLPSTWTMPSSVVVSLPSRLRAAQAVFDETGGLHAAGLFTPDGLLVELAEDVGRHNAVDKVVGRMLLREALPLSGHVLCVSGRTSFEIVQKALLAGVPLVAAVSAPSSLAIDLARESGVTLIGFVRGDGFNIYAHGERIG